MFTLPPLNSEYAARELHELVDVNKKSGCDERGKMFHKKKMPSTFHIKGTLVDIL